MNIIQTDLHLGDMTLGNNPNVLVLHHAEKSSCTIEDVNTWHKERGWTGCGYHYFVCKDGSIYKGRPDNAVGAHVQGHNTNSLGICAEGSYMTETMPGAQAYALSGLVAYLKVKYGITSVKKHSDLMSTDCPGTNYPFDKINSGVSTPTVQAPIGNDIIRALQAECNIQGFSHQIVDGISGVNTLSGCPLLIYGASGKITKCMQELLIQHGYGLENFGADSDFGKETSDAVKKFQEENGLIPDREVGKNTWKKLLGL